MVGANANQRGHLFIQSIVLLVILVFQPVANNRDGLEREEFLQKFAANRESGWPAGPESDHFNLFNLFNVFRGTESRLLDQQGNLIPLDTSLPTGVVEEEPAKPAHRKQAGSEARNFNYLSDGLDTDYLRSLLTIKQRGSADGQLDKNSPEVESNVIEDASRALKSPVILVPGYGGTRLEAKLHKPSAVRYFCDLESDWTDIWINVKMLLPYMIDCLIDNLRLEYDPATRTTRNTAGVEIRVKSPNSISSVEYLHQLPLSGFAYFAPIVDKMLKLNVGYQRERTILGAPYDFRKAPNELGEHFERIKSNTELLVRQTNKKVTLICHSMGCNQMLYFLQRQPASWKEKHVRRLVSLAAPWAGSFSALRAAALGDDLGMPYLFSESKLIKVQRSLPSTIFLFPHKDVFPEVPLIKSFAGSGRKSRASASFAPSSNLTNFDNATLSTQEEPVYEQEEPVHYTINNIEAFFKALNHPDGYQMWLDTKDLLGSLEAPGVELWCLVGRGQKTLGRMEFPGAFPSSPGVELYDDGDGTVTLESARYCANWINRQPQRVEVKEFNLSHMAILKDSQVLEFIGGILGEE